MSDPVPIRSRSACPVCAAPPVDAYRPFCSRGCKDRDLLQWLGDGYRVPGPPADESTISGLDSDRDPSL